MSSPIDSWYAIRELSLYSTGDAEPEPFEEVLGEHAVDSRAAIKQNSVVRTIRNFLFI
jgi:hypothetical protein